MAGSNFIDYVKILCRSGKGGAGSCHFHRAKYVPKGGPDGGNGGRGGHIILRGNRNLWTLLHLKYQRHIFATDGQPGGECRSFGKDGEDKIIEVLAKRENWIIDRYRLHGNIRDFFDEQRIGGNAQRDESDCRSHFYHWIIKHLNTTRYGTKRKSTTYRDSDVTAVSAEDYEGAF